jgi:hypothetical protein
MVTGTELAPIDLWSGFCRLLRVFLRDRSAIHFATWRRFATVPFVWSVQS